MDKRIFMVSGVSALLALAGPVAAGEEPAETTRETVVETRWVQVPGSRIYREVKVGEPVHRQTMSHLPVFIITRDELDDTAQDNVGNAIKEGLPAAR